jgi:protein-S-isoprenylcysteine O-methyltransferase Ste14
MMRVKMSWFIDGHKGVTILVMLGLMALYRRWDNQTAWLYIALHGGYGILWVLKSRVFPDRRWERKVSLPFAVFGILGGLSLYWIGGWMVFHFDVYAPAWYNALAVLVYVLGVFLHFASDMQKHAHLTLRPGELITDGFFSSRRNPNYLGELLIYAGFGMLAMHWIPLAILALWVLAYWLPNMIRKDRSLSRYEEFESYRKASRLFF